MKIPFDGLVGWRGVVLVCVLYVCVFFRFGVYCYEAIGLVLGWVVLKVMGVWLGWLRFSCGLWHVPL